MPKLSAKDRAALKPSQFGLPDKARTKKARKQSGNYPMPDEGHAISAIRLAKKHRKAGKLSKPDYDKIRRKAHAILKDAGTGEDKPHRDDDDDDDKAKAKAKTRTKTKAKTKAKAKEGGEH